MAELIARYPPAYSAQYVQASSQYNSNYYPWYAVNPSTALTGYSIHGNAWLCAAGAALPQKFGIYFGEQISVSRIVLNNYHSGGVYTEAGVKTCRVYGGNDAVVFANISNTSDLTELTLLGEFVARQHVAANDADPQVFDINAPGLWSYVVIIPVDSWGVYNYVGFRRIEIQEKDSAYALVAMELLAPYRSEIPMARVAMELLAPYRSARQIARELGAPYRAAWAVATELNATYQSMLPVAVELSAPVLAVQPVVAELLALYRAADLQPVAAELLAPYLATDLQPVAMELRAPYRAGAELPGIDDYSIAIAWQSIDPVRISITMSRQQSAISAEVEVADEWAYTLATRHAPAALELWGYQFTLVVDGRARREAFGEHSYTILLASPAVQLEYPWAAKVEGELTGMASAIARQLTGSIPLHWQAVDWYILPGVWLAAAEAPLGLLQQLVSAAGAVLLSQPDGSLVVQPLYPVSVSAWPAATVTQHVSTASEVITLESGAEHREGINIITVSDQAAATDSLRIEEDSEKKTGAITQVLVYQTPWRDDFELSHRGDTATAGISPMGIEERVITDEEIIIQDGEASAAYPVYAVLGARYNKLILGSPTYSEDGKITTAIKGDSILLLSYRTRARRYQVRESMLNDLLVVAENTEAA